MSQFNQKYSQELEQKNFLNLYNAGAELGKGSFGLVKEISWKDSKRNVLAAKRVTIDKKMSSKKNQIMIEDLNDEIKYSKLFTSDDVFSPFPYYLNCIIEDTEHFTYYYLISEKLYKNLNDQGAASKFTRVIPPIQRLKIYYILFKGLQIMEQNSLVHSDLKPENVMLNNRNLQMIKIIDFGLADKVNRSSKGGSPLFNSPEKIKGVEGNKYGHDIWAMGLTIASIEAKYDILFDHYDGYNEKKNCFTLNLNTLCHQKLVSNIKSIFRTIYNVSELEKLILEMITYDHRQRPNAQYFLGKLNTLIIELEKQNDENLMESSKIHYRERMKADQAKMENLNPFLRSYKTKNLEKIKKMNQNDKVQNIEEFSRRNFRENYNKVGIERDNRNKEGIHKQKNEEKRVHKKSPILEQKLEVKPLGSGLKYEPYKIAQNKYDHVNPKDKLAIKEVKPKYDPKINYQGNKVEQGGYVIDRPRTAYDGERAVPYDQKPGNHIFQLHQKTPNYQNNIKPVNVAQRGFSKERGYTYEPYKAKPNSFIDQNEKIIREKSKTRNKSNDHKIKTRNNNIYQKQEEHLLENPKFNYVQRKQEDFEQQNLNFVEKKLQQQKMDDKIKHLEEENRRFEGELENFRKENENYLKQNPKKDDFLTKIETEQGLKKINSGNFDKNEVLEYGKLKRELSGNTNKKFGVNKNQKGPYYHQPNSTGADSNDKDVQKIRGYDDSKIIHYFLEKDQKKHTTFDQNIGKKQRKYSGDVDRMIRENADKNLKAAYSPVKPRSPSKLSPDYMNHIGQIVNNDQRRKSSHERSGGRRKGTTPLRKAKQPILYLQPKIHNDPQPTQFNGYAARIITTKAII